MTRVLKIAAFALACAVSWLAAACFLGAPVLAAPCGYLASPAPQERGATPKEKAAAKDARLRVWKSLDEKKRFELRKRYERMKSLSPEERARLLERAERLRVEMDKTLAALGPEERAAVEALAPDERRRVLRALIGDRAKVVAARIRSQLTPEERKELSAAEPAERAKILGRHRRRQLEGLPERVRKLGQELELSPAELRRLQEGRPAERRSQIARMVRRRMETYVENNGLPEGVEPKQWKRFFEGDDETFLRAMRRIRIHNPEFGVPERQLAGRKRQREAMARRLESFGAPRTKDRAAWPRAKDQVLRRRAILNARPRIEELIIQRLELSLDVAARLRMQSDDEFLRTYRLAIRVAREGGDLEATLRRRAGARTGGGSERGSGRGREKGGR